MVPNSPLCDSATLLAPHFARLDDVHAPLCTPTLRALAGGEHHAMLLASPHIASPSLAGWTPRLPGNDAETGEQQQGVGGPRPRALDRASLAAAVKANEGARAVEPPPALPLPALLQSNFLLPMSLPTNVRQYADVPSPEQAHAGSASSLQAQVCTMIKVEPETGSDQPGKSERPRACHSPTLTAAGVAAALAEDICSTPIQQNCVGEHDEEQQDGATPREGSCRKSGSGLLRPAADTTEEDALDTRLTLEFLEENGYFDMPIQQAAAELRVGVTTLKKVCRVNSIGRWPFRKRSSLNRLIEKTREYFAGDPQQCAEALAQLEAQRSVLRSQQGEDIPDSVKRYRQSIFKLDYKCKKIARDRRTPRGAAVNVTLAALDKVQTMRQLGVGTPDDCLMCAADVDQGDEDAEMVEG
ncbi:hypothetical protein ACK3TF_003063 [Chlorella vulgaris]